jgi:Aminotransferase class-V
LAELLYLDTARLGRMSQSARQAQQACAELAAEEGGSAYFDDFLRSGAAADALTLSRFVSLTGWQGTGFLKESLRTLAKSVPDLPVLLANRSAQLMKLAARLLFLPCRNVLVTDLGWPGYHEILASEARRANRTITLVSIRRAIVDSHASEDEVVEQICGAFAQQSCDGLFLTAVNNQGIRLPVERLVRLLEAKHRICFVVVDGAQDFCHVSSDLRGEYCDFYLAGSHKWLGAHCPMGLGFYGRKRSRGFVETILDKMLAIGDLDDPLLRFVTQLEARTGSGTTETVNLLPLFCCQGAVADAHRVDGAKRFTNVDEAVRVAQGTGWAPLLPAHTFRSGILLLQAERAATQQIPPDVLRSSFRCRNVALTTYEGGLLRLSMPEQSWRTCDLDTLHCALQALA